MVDGSGNVRIADFALSVIVAEAANLTFDSVHRGNLRWMAPEFLDPESSPMLTKQGDIYSFGCVMLQVRQIMIISDSLLSHDGPRSFQDESPIRGLRV